MAAQAINHVVLVGNLCSDPELRSLPSGTSVCKLRLGVNTRRKDSQSGGWEDKPTFFDVTFWGAQGEHAARYPGKGLPGGLQGRRRGGERAGAGGRQRRVDHAVRLHPALAAEGFRLDLHAEMTFPARPLDAVRLVSMRIIHHF